ncbi:MAG: hypothetical protein PVF56_02980 [Desulfobacterales bacterium]|jgi:hypothetical protein
MRDNFINFQRTYLTRQNKYYNYAANLFESVLESAVFIFITAALNIILLNFAKMCWFTYKSTHIGKVFLNQFGNNYDDFVKILKGDLIGLSVELTLAAFIICLILSCIFQLFHVARFFHGIGSFLYKLIYVGMPLTVIVSYYYYSRPGFEFEYYRTAYILYSFSTICLFNLCFKISNKLIPELGALFKGASSAVCALARTAKSKPENQPPEEADVKPEDGSELPFGA